MPPKTRKPPAKTTARKPPAKRKRARRKRVKVTVALFQCPKCKLKTNNPFTRFAHTCLVGFTAAQRAAALRNLEAARRARKG